MTYILHGGVGEGGGGVTYMARSRLDSCQNDATDAKSRHRRSPSYPLLSCLTTNRQS